MPVLNIYWFKVLQELNLLLELSVDILGPQMMNLCGHSETINRHHNIDFQYWYKLSFIHTSMTIKLLSTDDAPQRMNPDTQKQSPV